MCEYYVSRFDDELNGGWVTEFGPDDMACAGKRLAQTGNRDFIALIEQKSSGHRICSSSRRTLSIVASPSSSASTAATVFPAAAVTRKPRLTNEGKERL